MQKKLSILILIMAYAFDVTAQTKNLWITTSDGGNSNDGTILKADSSGSNWQVVTHFQNFNGSYPQASMILGPDDNIYGTTRRGGVSDSCIIYSLDTSTYTVTNVHDFMASPNQGAIPYSGMLLTSYCDMYGLTFDGGSNNSGVIYYFNPASNFYAKLYDFTSATGSRPFGELLEHPNGMLYGMTSEGGTNGGGVIFAFEPFSTNYFVVHNFISSSGASPAYGNLILATNGLLYGLAHDGANGDGVIFSFDPISNVYTNLHNFNNPINGLYPFGSLVQASNGKLYGMTIAGGPGGKGTLYSFDIITNTFTLLVSFNGANGDYAQRGLVEVSPGLLMGTTMRGGLNNQGIILTYNINTGVYTKIFDFDGTTTGGHPTSDIFMTGWPQTIPCLVSIKENPQIENFSIFPNPVNNGTFNIEFLEFEKQVEVSIMDIGMKVVYSKLLNNVSKSSSIPIKTDFTSGIYMVKLISTKNTKTFKLIIE